MYRLCSLQYIFVLCAQKIVVYIPFSQVKHGTTMSVSDIRILAGLIILEGNGDLEKKQVAVTAVTPRFVCDLLHMSSNLT